MEQAQRQPLLEAVLSRDRAIVIAALVAVTLGAWAYLLAGAGMESHEMDGMSMPMMRAEWSPEYFGVMTAMWAAMMAAMMLPSASPMMLFYAAIARKRAAGGRPLVATALFVLGYVALWSAFSVAAALLQWALAEAALLSPMMETTSQALAGALFIAAGVYQWTPLKQACLARCRSPIEFVFGHWREGRWGAFAMGLRHGMFCLGCCWLLMLLLFVGGLMNLLWIAGLAAFVLVEKLAPGGGWASRAAGAALVLWGAAVLGGLA